MTGPIVVAEGSDITMTCEASNDRTQGYQYQWKKGTELLHKKKDRYTVKRRGRDFTISNVIISDSGQYHCEFNINGEDVPSFEVQVIVKSELLTSRNVSDSLHVGKPKVISGPPDEQVIMSIVSGNEQVTLTCQVTGDDIAGYWETLGSDPLPNKANMSSLNNDKTRLQLIIVGARPEHSEIYRCVVYSQWGIAQSNNTNVTITSENNKLMY